MGRTHHDGERDGRGPYPVHRDLGRGLGGRRPVPLDESFQRVYGPSAGGGQVSARLTHPGLPGSAGGRPWPLRAADFDTAGHVNNAVHWAAVEDELGGLDWLPGRAELEYHRPILPGAEPELVTSREPGELRAWLREGPQRLASAWLTARSG